MQFDSSELHHVHELMLGRSATSKGVLGMTWYGADARDQSIHVDSFLLKGLKPELSLTILETKQLLLACLDTEKVT